MKRKIFQTIAIIIGLLITGTLIAASLWPVINVVETGQTPEYPELQPHYYSADPQRVFDEAKASAQTMQRWTMHKADVSTNTIEATTKTKVLGFTDDVTIKVEPVTEFVTRVHVRSASRVGKGDFGQNARNITTFFTELDRRLGAVKFNPNANKAKEPAKK
jgi:uncharacterized protein (DUF1499 family)